MRILIITLALVALVLADVGAPAPASASTVLDGEIVFPQDVSATEFANTWGARRSGGRRHTGSDLMAPRLTPAYAIADGVVTRMHHSRLGGYGLWIDHGDGVVSVFLQTRSRPPRP